MRYDESVRELKGNLDFFCEVMFYCEGSLARRSQAVSRLGAPAETRAGGWVSWHTVAHSAGGAARCHSLPAQQPRRGSRGHGKRGRGVEGVRTRDCSPVRMLQSPEVRPAPLPGAREHPWQSGPPVFSLAVLHFHCHGTALTHSLTSSPRLTARTLEGPHYARRGLGCTGPVRPGAVRRSESVPQQRSAALTSAHHHTSAALTTRQPRRRGGRDGARLSSSALPARLRPAACGSAGPRRGGGKHQTLPTP